MNISQVFFLILSCFFSFSVFSQDGVEDHTVFNLCFNQLLQRRVSLQEEMVTVSGEMKNAEDQNAVFSNYSSRIFQLMLRVNVLFLIEGKPIDVSENTCDEFIDKSLSDFEIRMVAIDNLFRSTIVDTVEMVRYKMGDAAKKQKAFVVDEDSLRRLKQMMVDQGFPNMDQGYIPDIDDGGHTTSGI